MTNGLYLVLATRLYRVGGTPACWQASEREWGFLSSWMGLQEPGNSLLMESGLVRERVSTYANGDSVRGYDSGTAWAGDQGLILGGLVDRIEVLRQQNAPSDAHLGLAKRILDGVRSQMVQNGILIPWIPAHGSAPGGDGDDYQTGIAVFMRYLLYAFQTNPDLRTHILQSGYRDVAAATAAAPASGNALVKSSNTLAAQVAAIVLTEAA